MKIGINLASEPFRRDRPMLIGSAVVALLMMASLGTLIFLAVTDQRLIERDRKVQAQLDRELTRVTAEQRKVDAEVRKSENSETLERSILINELLLRKGISWTRIFADLEKTLPPNVRITQIKPQVDNNNRIVLEMTIASESAEPLTTFMMKLEGSDVFGAPTVSVQQAPTQTDPLYRDRMTVNYVQKF
jgi:Tfp pilus assembly protein PilN